VVAHPGGAVVGPPAEVAAALDRLAAADGRDPLEQQVVQALRPFLAGDRTQTRPGARHWSRPAVAYWISGPRNQPGWHDCKAGSQVGRLLPSGPTGSSPPGPSSRQSRRRSPPPEHSNNIRPAARTTLGGRRRPLG
jgi:hypothetical protein